MLRRSALTDRASGELAKTYVAPTRLTHRGRTSNRRRYAAIASIRRACSTQYTWPLPTVTSRGVRVARQSVRVLPEVVLISTIRCPTAYAMTAAPMEMRRTEDVANAVEPIFAPVASYRTIRSLPCA